PQVAQLLVASDLSYVTFSGLTFEHDNFTTPIPQGHVSMELEPTASAALSFQNSNHITFTSGTIRRIAGTGLDFISCITPTADPSSGPVPGCGGNVARPGVR